MHRQQQQINRHYLQSKFSAKQDYADVVKLVDTLP